MQHPASRIAAALLLAATAAVAWLAFSGRPSSAYAHLVEPLLNAKTATFNLSVRTAGKDHFVGKALVSGPIMRMQLGEGDDAQVSIVDSTTQTTLVLNPQAKQAMFIRAVGGNAGPSAGMLDEIRKLLTPAQDEKNVKREALGERDIDGRTMTGYRVTSPVMTIEVWGDPKTLLPQTVIQRMTAFPNSESRLTDFKFDVELDPALFSMEPPAGYTLTTQQLDASKPTEQDLIAALKAFAPLNNGLLPDVLNMETALAALAKNAKPKPEEILKSASLFSRGFAFVNEAAAQENADAHYAGKGLKLGVANTPILWYRPEGQAVYRIIFADLSVKESAKAPKASNAQPLKP